MKIFGKDLENEIVIVAEIGVNHEGNPDVASKLVRQAAEAGADAVKFQTYSPERFISSSDPDRLKRVGQFSLDEATHRRLAREATENGIAFFSSAITEDVMPLLSELGQAIKIASGDLTFEPVIRGAAQTGLPVILSTGLGTVDEIDEAVGWLRDEIGDSQLAERVVLLHCISAYPTPVDEANVRAIPFLAERYGLSTGYSNHVVGPDACLAAVALGACMLEVHFTDQKSGREFRDHEMSMEPADIAELVRRSASFRASLGDYNVDRQPSEAGNLQAVRKGIVAARDIAPDTKLTREDLMFARPANEFSASEISDVVGRKLKCSITTGEQITRENVVD